MTQQSLCWAHTLRKAIIEKDTCTPMFIAALFTIARTQKQPRYPLTDEWIKKLWYIYTMEYHSAIKRNAFESILKRWMNLEPITQSRVESRKMVLIILQGSNGDRDRENRLVVTGEVRRGWGKLSE